MTSQPSGDQKIGFYFFWVNSSANYAVIEAAAFLSAAGHLRAHAPWGLAATASIVATDARLNLWLGWPTGLTSTTSDGETLGSCAAAGWFFGGPDTD